MHFIEIHNLLFTYTYIEELKVWNILNKTIKYL